MLLQVQPPSDFWSSFLAWLADSSPTDYIGSIGLVASGIFFTWRYYSEKRVQRSEAGNRIVSELETNEWLRLACQMVDWTSRSIPLPPEITRRTLPDIPRGDGGMVVFQHDTAKMGPALSTPEIWNTETALYRDAFDALLTWLDRLHTGITSGIYTAADVLPVRYYVRQLFNPQHHPKETAAAILHFINTYYEPGRHLELLRRLNEALPSHAHP
jgi:hypothetical protein